MPAQVYRNSLLKRAHHLGGIPCLARPTAANSTFAQPNETAKTTTVTNRCETQNSHLKANTYSYAPKPEIFSLWIFFETTHALVSLLCRGHSVSSPSVQRNTEKGGDRIYETAMADFCRCTCVCVFDIAQSGSG